jgi:hypothetical protein
VIGRSRDCDLQVPDANVSRRHAELRQEGASYWIVDLGSTNGTEVNGRRQKRAKLRQGDTITVGSTERGYALVPSTTNDPVPLVFEFHGAGGDGNGVIVQRGMPRPTSYHDERLRAADDQHFFDVITNGYGAMYSYASRVPPGDRWAIVAYIRALQLSRHASIEDVPPEERHRLSEAP